MVPLPTSVIIPMRDKFSLDASLEKVITIAYYAETRNSWYALDSKEYFLLPPCLDDSEK